LRRLSASEKRTATGHLAHRLNGLPPRVHFQCAHLRRRPAVGRGAQVEPRLRGEGFVPRMGGLDADDAEYGAKPSSPAVASRSFPRRSSRSVIRSLRCAVIWPRQPRFAKIDWRPW